MFRKCKDVFFQLWNVFQLFLASVITVTKNASGYVTKSFLYWAKLKIFSLVGHEIWVFDKLIALKRKPLEDINFFGKKGPYMRADKPYLPCHCYFCKLFEETPFSE